MNEEKYVFIKEGFSLTNRIWLKVNEELSKQKVMTYIDEFIKQENEILKLELHFYIEKQSKYIIEKFIDIIKEVYKFKVGYEKSFPLIFIYFPYKELEDEYIAAINECDIYRPGICIYLLVRDKELPLTNELVSMRELAKEVFHKDIECQKLGLNTTTILLLEKERQKLVQLFDLQRLIYTWDTSYTVLKPLIQVSPKIELDREDIVKLSNYVSNENEIENILDTICGWTSMIYRYIENKKIPTTYVPLGGCGAGRSETLLNNDGSAAPCFYLSNAKIKENVYSVCKNCPHVAECTGCLCMCAQKDKCQLKDSWNELIQFL